MLKWIGNTKGSAGLVGIPARDLTDEEVKNLGGEKQLLSTGLYEKVASRQEKKDAKKEGD